MTSAELMAYSARLVSTAGPPAPSPCVSICRMDEATGLCEGCFRTIDEIMAWGTLGERAKREIWELIAQRAAATIALPALPDASAAPAPDSQPDERPE